MTFTEVEKEEMAINSIRNYLNKDFTDEEIIDKFELAIKRIVSNLDDILETNTSGISSITQGSQSITYDTSTEKSQISDDVKRLLPKPYIRVF